MLARKDGSLVKHKNGWKIKDGKGKNRMEFDQEVNYRPGGSMAYQEFYEQEEEEEYY